MCWGHVTGVTEDNIRTFAGNWTGTASITGSGDAEALEFETGQYKESEVVETGEKVTELSINTYTAGDTAPISYRHAASAGACLAAAWNDYTIPFSSLGFAQVRISAAADFSPSDIAGLSMWLKADAGLFKDAAKSQPATSDGDAIYTWADQSENGNDVVQVTEASRPLLKLAILNGMPVIFFDGSNDYFTIALNQPTPCSIFVVAERLTGGDANYQVGITAIAPNQPFGCNISLKAQSTENWGEYINQWTVTSYGCLNTWRVISLIQSGLSDTAVTNGNIETLSDSTRYIGDINDRRAIGGDPSLGAGYLSGYIAEIIIYNSAISAPNRVLVETYLNSRWAVYA
jgi:hypothetical protein